jgi:hypothetical protein
MSYTLILKNEKLVYYRLIRDLLALLNLGGFIWLLLHTENKIIKTYCIIFILLTACHVLLIFFERLSHNYFNDPIHRIVFLCSAPGWALSGYWWLVFVLLLLMVFDLLAKRKLKVKVSENAVYYPSFPAQEILWNDLTNIVLKDGLLTIDLKNNKLIQQPVQNTDIKIREDEFNEFCRQQLNKTELYKYN